MPFDRMASDRYAARYEPASFEQLRPEGFLQHASIATSQYDEQYRSMAREILWLRESQKALVAALSAILAKISGERVEMECPVCNCHELPDIKCKAEVEQARSVLAAIRGEK